MLFQLARYLPEPYKEPSNRKLRELCNLREDAGSAYVKIVSSFRYQKDSDPYADLYSFRTAYLEFMASHPQSLEVREKNPKNLRAKTTDLDNRAKINSTDGLLNIRNDNPISLDELIDHIVKVHAHPDNLIPVGISTLDYEVVRSAPERVRQISLKLFLVIG